MNELTLKQLADEYNQIILAAGQGEMNTVKRFSDRASAERRLAIVQEKYGTLPEEPEVQPEKKVAVLGPQPSRDKAPRASYNPVGSVAGMRVLYELRLKNPEVTRREYVAAAVAAGIKKSTAGAQWKFSFEYLQNRFGKEVS